MKPQIIQLRSQSCYAQLELTDLVFKLAYVGVLVDVGGRILSFGLGIYLRIDSRTRVTDFSQRYPAFYIPHFPAG